MPLDPDPYFQRIQVANFVNFSDLIRLRNPELQGYADTAPAKPKQTTQSQQDYTARELRTKGMYIL